MALWTGSLALRLLLLLVSRLKDTLAGGYKSPASFRKGLLLVGGSWGLAKVVLVSCAERLLLLEGLISCRVVLVRSSF